MFLYKHFAKGRDFVPNIIEIELMKKLDKGYEKLSKIDQTKLPLAHEAVPEPTIYFGGSPASILSIGSEIKLGDEANFEKITASLWIIDFISSFFGPFRMSKLITDEQGLRYLASDLRTVLKKVGIAHPIAQLFVGAGLTLSKTVGDGSVYTMILAGKILERFWGLLKNGFKASIILDGLLDAYNVCLQISKTLAIDSISSSSDIIKDVLRSSLTNRLPAHAREKVIEMIYRVLSIVGLESFSLDFENIVDIKTVEGGTLLDSFVLDGVAIFKEFPHPDMRKRLEDVKIAIVKDELRIPEKFSRDIDLKLDIDGGIEDFFNRKNIFLKEYADKLWRLDVKLVIVEKGVDPMLVEIFAKNNINLVFGLPHPEVDLIANAVNALPVPNPSLLSEDCLGWAGVVEEVKIGRKNLLLIYRCKKPKNITIVLQGSDNLLLYDVERCIKHSLPLLFSLNKDGRIVYGGGAFEIEMSLRLRNYADGIPDRRQLVFKAIADAFEDVVSILSMNIGKDPIETVSKLKAMHTKGFLSACVSIDSKEGIGKADEIGLYDALVVKMQAIKTAFELVYSIMRIDGIIIGRKLSEPEYYYVKRIKGTSEEARRKLKKEYGIESLE